MGYSMYVNQIHRVVLSINTVWPQISSHFSSLESSSWASSCAGNTTLKSGLTTTTQPTLFSSLRRWWGPLSGCCNARCIHDLVLLSVMVVLDSVMIYIQCTIGSSLTLGQSLFSQMYYQNYHQYSAVQTAVRLVPMFFSGIVCNVFFALMAARVPLVWLVCPYIDTLSSFQFSPEGQALERCQQARQFFCSTSVNRQYPTGPSNSQLYGSLSWASTWYFQLGHYSLQRLLCPTVIVRSSQWKFLIDSDLENRFGLLHYRQIRHMLLTATSLHW